MARSAQSSAFGSLPGFQAPDQTAMPAYQSPNLPNLAAPTPMQAPSGVQNPANLPRKQYLAGLLDPLSTTYIGNQAKSAMKQATSQLRQNLAGYGYQVTETAEGTAEAKRDTAQPGELYQREYEMERARANARGMLYSSFADEAVGMAWQRLNDQERQFFNQHSAQVSSVISGLSAQYSEVVGELMGLYGSDIQYALENPPPEAPAAAPSPEPAPASSEPAPGPSLDEQLAAIPPDMPSSKRVIALGDEVSPHQASMLAQQGYKIGRPGSGRYKGKLVAVRKG